MKTSPVKFFEPEVNFAAFILNPVKSWNQTGPVVAEKLGQVCVLLQLRFRSVHFDECVAETTFVNFFYNIPENIRAIICTASQITEPYTKPQASTRSHFPTFPKFALVQLPRHTTRTANRLISTAENDANV